MSFTRMVPSSGNGLPKMSNARKGKEVGMLWKLASPSNNCFTVPAKGMVMVCIGSGQMAMWTCLVWMGVCSVVVVVAVLTVGWLQIAVGEQVSASVLLRLLGIKSGASMDRLTLVKQTPPTVVYGTTGSAGGWEGPIVGSAWKTWQDMGGWGLKLFGPRSSSVVALDSTMVLAASTSAKLSGWPGKAGMSEGTSRCASASGDTSVASGSAAVRVVLGKPTDLDESTSPSGRGVTMLSCAMASGKGCGTSNSGTTMAPGVGAGPAVERLSTAGSAWKSLAYMGRWGSAWEGPADDWLSKAGSAWTMASDMGGWGSVPGKALFISYARIRVATGVLLTLTSCASARALGAIWMLWHSEFSKGTLAMGNRTCGSGASVGSNCWATCASLTVRSWTAATWHATSCKCLLNCSGRISHCCTTVMSWMAFSKISM